MTATQIVDSITSVYGDDDAAYAAALTSAKQIQDLRTLEFERDALQDQTSEPLAAREVLISDKNAEIVALRDAIVAGISI